MINLLPQKEKGVIQAEENKKVILILGIIGFIFILCFILVLTTIKVYIAGQAEVERIILEQEKEEFKVSEEKNFSEEIRSANESLTALKSFYKNQVKVTEILEGVSRNLSEGLYLNEFSYQKEISQIVISGFSPTREALIEFKDNLEGNFENVHFPPDSWLKATNIDFASKFKIKE